MTDDRTAQILDELAPAGPLQTFLAEQVARSMERLARVDAREPLDEPADAAWQRDQARAERSFYRALTEFRRAVKADAKAAKIAEAGRAEIEKSSKEEVVGVVEAEDKQAPIAPRAAGDRPRARPAETGQPERCPGSRCVVVGGRGTCARAGGVATIAELIPRGGGLGR